LRSAVTAKFQRETSTSFVESVSKTSTSTYSCTFRVPVEENKRIHACQQFDEWDLDIYVRHYDFLVLRIGDKRLPECFLANDPASRRLVKRFSPSANETARNVHSIKHKVGTLRFLVPNGEVVTLYDEELRQRTISDPGEVRFIPQSGGMPNAIYSPPATLHEIVRNTRFQRRVWQMIDEDTEDAG